MNKLALIEEYCELTKTSLRFKRDVTKTEWMRVFKALRFIEGSVQFWIGDCLAGKAGGLDHLWPENIDHQNPELNTYQLIIFTKDMNIGVMWTMYPVFAV